MREPITFLRMKNMPKEIFSEPDACSLLYRFISRLNILRHHRDRLWRVAHDHPPGQYLKVEPVSKLFSNPGHYRTESITPSTISVVTINQERLHAAKLVCFKPVKSSA